MTSIGGTPLNIPAEYRDEIPTDTSDTSNHIKFTKLVLDLIQQLSKPEAKEAAAKPKHMQRKVIKRTRQGNPIPPEQKKVDRTTVLVLAKLASLKNTKKITQGKAMLSSVQEDELMDPQEAKGRLKYQLNLLNAKENKETAMRKERAAALLQKTAAKPKSPEELRAERFLAEEKATIQSLNEACDKMDHALRSLKPFTFEGLKLEVGKQFPSDALKRKERISSELSLQLHQIDETTQKFSAEYFAATILANTHQPHAGEELLTLVTSTDEKFGKLPLVQQQMKALKEYTKNQQAKSKIGTPPQTTLPFSRIYEMKDLPPVPDVNTKALISAQGKHIEVQRELAQAAQREQARGRGLQYFGMYGTIAMGSLGFTAATGANLGRALAETGAQVAGGGAAAQGTAGALGTVGGTIGGGAIGVTLLKQIGPTVTATALATQMPTWDAKHWKGGAIIFLATYTTTLGLNTLGIPLPPFETACLLTYTLVDHLAKRIDKVISWTLNRNPRGYLGWETRGASLSEKDQEKYFSILFETAKLYVEKNPEEESREPPQKRQRQS